MRFVMMHNNAEKMEEIMWAEMAPDVYGGENCDEIVPMWIGCGEGEKDGEEKLGDVLELSAKTFPPGTTVIISVPVCEGEFAGSACDPNADFAKDGKCQICGFDWKQWTLDRYS